MWTRRELKAQAKSFLRNHYWQAFIVVLITALLAGGALNLEVPFSGGGFNQEAIFDGSMNFDNPDAIFNSAAGQMNTVLFAFGTTFALVLIFLSLVLLITVGYVVQVGQARFFLDGFKGDVNVSKLLSGFNKEEYWPIVKAQFRTGLYIFLWSLLFIIPGIIKAYAYRYVPYILADDSTLSPSEAISKSVEMTDGHKWSIFVLDLSFFWWNMISLFTFGLSSFFVAPYVEATNARLYNVLSDKVDLEYEFVDFNRIP